MRKYTPSKQDTVQVTTAEGVQSHLTFLGSRKSLRRHIQLTYPIMFQHNPPAYWRISPVLEGIQNSIAVKPGSCCTRTNSHFLFLITVQSATSQMLSQQPTLPPPLVQRAYEHFRTLCTFCWQFCSLTASLPHSCISTQWISMRKPNYTTNFNAKPGLQCRHCTSACLPRIVSDRCAISCFY